MSLTIKSWLDKYLDDISSHTLAKQLEQYRLGYIGQSYGHSSFYGGPYIGLHNIYFTTAYENKLLAGLLSLDRDTLQQDLHDVDSDGRSKLVPSIYPERKVSGEVFNIVLLYLAHRLVNIPHPVHENVSAAFIPLQIYAYRTLAAVHSNSFRYLGNEAIAKATYNKLSNKFILKQLKSWDKYIEYRTVNSLDQAMTTKALSLDNDEKGLLVLILLSNAIRSTFKIIYQLYLEVKDSGGGETSSTYVQEGEENTYLKEVTNAESHTQHLLLKIADGSMINVTYAKQVAGMVPRVLYPDILQMLKLMSSEYLKHKKLIDAFVGALAAYVVDRIQNSEVGLAANKAELVERLVTSVKNSKASAMLITLRQRVTELATVLIPSRNIAYHDRLKLCLIIYMIILWVAE